MEQTRLGSFIETMLNVAIGFAVNMVANHYVYPRFGFNPTLQENIVITLIYTAISIVRQYVLRRWFNARLHAAAMRMGKRLSA